MPASPATGSGGSPAAAPSPASLRGKVAIDTHGCKLNQADSNLLARQFAQAGYLLVESVADADVYVLNTCTVTATADAKARQALNSARRINPRAVIVAAGCYPQRAAAELARMPAVSLVVPNTRKEALVELASAALEEQARAAPLPGAGPAGLHPGPEPSRDAPALPIITPQAQRNRAMVKIQEGCDQVCAYCIVPRVRGRERSVPPDTLVAEINRHAAAGVREIVLTGTQLGSYGFDIPGASLLGLLQRILEDTTVPRIRVSSLQPQEISRELLDLWADGRLCPHFHVPLQSGSDRVLRAMRRRYLTAGYAAAVELVRRAMPDAGVTADLIVGFPGEGDAQFRESREFVREMGFSDMHIFPYSSRPGTSAAHFKDQVPPQVKRERVAEATALARRGFRDFRQRQLGTVRRVLWESPKEREGAPVWSGLTDNYIRVYTQNGDRALRNAITPARLVALDDDGVYAQPGPSHHPSAP